MIGGFGFLSVFAAIFAKIFFAADMTGNPLLLVGILATILSVQFFSLGLIGEVCARIYYANEHRTNYQIRELVNFERRAILKMPRRAA